MENKHIGSDFDDFLKEEGIQEEVTAAAIKRVIAWQLAEAMKKRHITKTEMATRMHTSRAVINRLLDEDDTSVFAGRRRHQCSLGHTGTGQCGSGYSVENRAVIE